jgi:hypothetical protein
VLLSSTKSLCIAVTEKQLVSVVAGEYLVSDGSRDFEQVLSILRELFRKISSMRALPGAESKALPRWLTGDLPSVALFLDNNWVRTFVCRWNEALRTHRDFLRYAEIEFERRFHSLPKGWSLVPDRLRPGGETVWCAYRLEQLKALESVAAESGFRIRSSLPCIIAEIASLEFFLEDTPVVYVSGGEYSKNVCWIEDGRIRDLIVLSQDIKEDTSLVDVFTARLKREPVEQVSFVHLIGTRAQTLKSLTAKEALKTEAAVFKLTSEMAVA